MPLGELAKSLIASIAAVATCSSLEKEDKYKYILSFFFFFFLITKIYPL